MIIKRNRVVIHELYWDDEYDQEELHKAADLFEEYWLNGYSPECGRDRPIYRPDSVKNSALCHVHYLSNNLYDVIGLSWQRNCKPSIPPYFRSHNAACDAMFLYAVSEEGTALLLTLLTADAHETIKKLDYMRAFSNISIAKFKELGEQAALPNDLKDLLHSPTKKMNWRVSK